MEKISQLFEQTSGPFLAILVVSVVALWFLPVLVAVFFNPKHVKHIAIACVPAGFSVIAWCAVMVWAFTGKVVDKYKDKLATN